MAAQGTRAGNSTVDSTGLTAEFRYVARQPILDLLGRVHGYELLFRSGPELIFRGDANQATRTMLDNTVIFGLERLTAGLPAFVNCTSEALVEELVDVLPSGMTVLEVLENIEPTRAVISACRRLKARGYRIALDDFVWKPGMEPLVQLADYIKVDFALMPAGERRELLERLEGHAVALVAEKVETQEQYQEARAEGFTLIQGYYFCRPVLLKNRKVPDNRLSQIEILRLLRQNLVNLHELAQLVQRDASLTYRLLRLVNSPLCAMRYEVRSVHTALLAVGEETFRRIATLAIARELSADRPPEILRMAFVRARFCELAAGPCGMDATEQYLLGMLSLLPAMLLIPMADIVASLPLREEIRQALTGSAVPERDLLAWLEHHEQGKWEACDAVAYSHGLEEDTLAGCYAEAVIWAESALQFA